MRTFHRRRFLILFPILGLILDPRLHEIHLTMRLLASTQVRPASAVAHREVHDHIGARLMTQHLLRTEVAAVVIELIDLLQRKQQHIVSARLTKRERRDKANERPICPFDTLTKPLATPVLLDPPPPATKM